MANYVDVASGSESTASGHLQLAEVTHLQLGRHRCVEGTTFCHKAAVLPTGGLLNPSELVPPVWSAKLLFRVRACGIKLL